MARGTGWLMAGLISGFVYGIVASVLQILAVLAFKPEIIAFLAQHIADQPALFQNVTAIDLFNLSISLIPMIAVTGGLLLGVIFSFIYSSVYGRVPGSTPVTKGPVFGLGLWLILNIGIGLVDLPQFGIYYYISGVVGGLVASVIYGFVLAVLLAYLNRE